MENHEIQNLAQHYVQSSSCPNSKIAVRKVLAKITPKAVILVLHGATLPSIIFALPPTASQPSMLEYLARNGYVVYSLDYRGYGLSSKPAAMDDPSMAGPPIMRHFDAAQDVLDVVAFIKDQHPDLAINLCGFSWGSSISGYLTSHHNWVNKLILLGPVYSYPNPQWLELADPSDTSKLNPGIKSYRLASRDRWCGLWDRELHGKDIDTYREPATLKAVLDHIEQSDVDWATKNQKNGHIRLSTGVLVDALQTYNQNPIYDAGKIQCPTLVLRGSLDTASLKEDADGLFNNLKAKKKRIDVDDATHYGILERKASQFFQAIVDFIED